MKLFLQKKCKIFERWGLRPQTPVPPAAGGFAPKPPAYGSPPQLQISGYAPGSSCKQTPIANRPPKQPPPIANFWLRAW